METRIKQWAIVDTTDPSMSQTLRFDLAAYLSDHPIELKVVENETLFQTRETSKVMVINTLGKVIANLAMTAKMFSEDQLNHKQLGEILQGIRKVTHDLIYNIATGGVICS
jgi:hypothetical protein